MNQLLQCLNQARTFLSILLRIRNLAIERAFGPWIFATTNEVAVAKRREAAQGVLTIWLEENPLRAWRVQQPPEGWNRSVLARQLAVSHTAVGAWETGKRLPVVDAFAKIETLTGITATQWMAWYESRPKES